MRRRVSLLSLMALSAVGLARGQAQLVVSPMSITAATQVGQIANRQLLTVTSSDGSPVQFLAYGDANWLIVGMNTPGGDLMTTPASFYVSFAALGVGAFGANVIITSSFTSPPNAGKTIAIPVSITIVDPNAPPDIYYVSNAASGTLATSVSPGEIVSIFGVGLGPLTPIGPMLTDGGNLSTSVGGVSVFFSSEEGVTSQQYAAPLLYVSSTQINCILPYEVAAWTQTPWPSKAWIQVSYTGRSSQLTYPVTYNFQLVPTAPGIFTLSGTGSGQAAVLNSDMTVNSATNPAAAGSTIAIYMTGEGQTSAPGLTGSITCSSGCSSLSAIPKPVATVTATIGGQPTYVAFYGEAPTIVAGLMQVNVVIPPNTPSGAVPLAITVGSSSTQSGVTVAVK